MHFVATVHAAWLIHIQITCIPNMLIYLFALCIEAYFNILILPTIYSNLTTRPPLLATH